MVFQLGVEVVGLVPFLSVAGFADWWLFAELYGVDWLRSHRDWHLYLTGSFS